MGTWTNADGLYVKFGVSEHNLAKGGAKNTGGNVYNELKVEVNYDDLAATGTETILEDGVGIPDGAHLKSAEFYVEEAFVGATATLTLGVIARDRTTEVDADGIDVTIAVTAIDAVGDTIACDGDLIGTTMATGGLITATEGTAAFTAGKGILTIKYYMPT